MSTFTLDDIRTAAEAKFGNTTIKIGDTDVVLVNALQLPKLKRDALIEKQKHLGEDDAPQEEILRDSLRLVIPSAHQAELLIESVGENLAVLLEIFSSYSKGTQLGEASASDD